MSPWPQVSITWITDFELPVGPFKVRRHPAWLCAWRVKSAAPLTLLSPSCFPHQKGERVPWCSTASSSRPLRPSSTTSRSCLRASCGRSASGGTARRRTSGGWPTRSGARASPGKPGASGARSWPKTTRTWPSSSSPNPATTSRCSRHPESLAFPRRISLKPAGTHNLY